MFKEKSWPTSDATVEHVEAVKLADILLLHQTFCNDWCQQGEKRPRRCHQEGQFMQVHVDVQRLFAAWLWILLGEGGLGTNILANGAMSTSYCRVDGVTRVSTEHGWMVDKVKGRSNQSRWL